MAQPSAGHPKIDERHEKIGIPFEAKSFPVEILSISEQNGVRLRATVSEFGPVLLSRILDVSETQAGIISVLFKYCDDNKLPLLDLKDFKKILQYSTQEGKKEFEDAYGFRFTSKDKVIVFSGDTGPSKSLEDYAKDAMNDIFGVDQDWSDEDKRDHVLLD